MDLCRDLMFVAYVHVFECGLVFSLCIFTVRKLIQFFPHADFGWVGTMATSLSILFFPPYLSNGQDDVKFIFRKSPFFLFRKFTCY